MADQQTQDNQNTDTGDDENEKTFWSKMTSLIDERFDAGVQRTIEKHSKPGQSRNGGRTSVPKIIADLMGGPFKPVE